MALLLLLLVSSMLSLKMNTTPAAGTYLPPFIVDISDIQEPALELTPTTMKLKPEYMQIKDPRTTDGYKHPPRLGRYQMLWAIHHRKQATHTSNLKIKTDLDQYQNTVPIPNTYTVANSDVFVILQTFNQIGLH